VSDVPVPFGTLLRKHRVAKGLTPAGLSLAAGLSKNTVSRLEAGAHHPTVDTITKLVEFLGLEGEEASALRMAGDVWPSPSTTATGRLPIRASTLEAQVDAIVDRATEVSAILAQLSGGCRLLTLTGPPGVGKSRIALEVARRLAEKRTPERGAGPEGAAPPLVDDIAFRDLATLRDPARVLPEIAAAVEFFEHGPGELRAGLEAHLRERRLLLLLDNVDPVVAAPVPLDTSGAVLGVAPLLAALVGAVPSLWVLATSRSALKVGTDTDHPVEPLGEESALALFVVSARDSVPGFRLTTATRGTVNEICVRVDRLPLAIQLVAARVRSLTPVQLLAHLGSRLPHLANAAHRGADHHKTMSAAIAWSHDLLDEDARLVFRRLAVFAGGCTVASAEAVCAGGDALAAPTLAVVVGMELLVDASFVRPDGADAERRRYAMLEVIREYALGHLAESGEEAAVRARHADHFLALADAATAGVLAGDREGLAWFALEEGNLLAAFDWTVTAGDAGRALPLAIALWSLWHPQGRLTEGRRALERALALPGGERSWRARALHVASALAQEQGDDDAARALAERALDLEPNAATALHLGDLARQRGDYGAATALLARGIEAAIAAGDMGGLIRAQEAVALLMQALGRDEEACQLLAEILVYYRSRGERDGVAATARNLGAALLALGDLAGARLHLDEALALGRERGNKPEIASAATLRGVVARHEEDIDRAVALLEEARDLYAHADDQKSVAACLVELGLVARLDGDPDRATVLCREGLGAAVRHGDPPLAATAVEGLAAVAVDRGQGARAARLLGVAAAARAAARVALTPLEQDAHERLIEAARALAGEDAYDAAFASGAALAPAQVLADGS